jgi:hypothetical protein
MLWANITVVNASNALPRVDLYGATDVRLSSRSSGNISLGVIADYAPGPHRVRVVMIEEIKGAERIFYAGQVCCRQIFLKVRGKRVQLLSNPFETDRIYFGHATEVFDGVVSEGYVPSVVF